MASVFQLSVQTVPNYGQQITLDLARKKASSTLSAGVKRTYADYAGQTKDPGLSIPPRKDFQLP